MASPRSANEVKSLPEKCDFRESYYVAEGNDALGFGLGNREQGGSI
jgi:hypothetical protein